MYVTVRKYTTGSEFADALVENESEVRSLIEGIEGFRAYYLARTDDGAVTISVYDDRSGAEESNRQAADWVRQNLSHLSVDPPQISAGEVALSLS
jgi:heme-degrading monooxygenase HmoA